MARTKEEILKAELSDYYWQLIENQTTLPDHEKTLKKWILQAMESYHQERLREELEKFAWQFNEVYCTKGIPTHITHTMIDNYLNSR
jgi:hypothetical protein